MSCFELPQWLIQRIDAIRRNFLWSKPQQNAGIHLLNWRTVCLPTTCGGLGVTDLHLQNIALLLRWWWNLFSPDRKLWKAYASSLYSLPGSVPGPLILRTKGSFFWNSISRLRPLFHSCSQFQIVSGLSISFWFDGWDGLPLALEKSGQINHRAICLSNAKRCIWDLLDAPVTHRQHMALQKLNRLTLRPGCDRLLWTISSSGTFTVKSAYRILSESGKVRSNIQPLWRTRVTPTMRCFFFLLLKNRLLTHDNMQRRNLIFTAGCVMCPVSRQCPETALHLFFHCPFATKVWTHLSLTVGYPLLSTSDSVLNTYLASMPSVIDYQSKWGTLFITTTWLMWKERNERIFRQHSTSDLVLSQKILQEAGLCLKYC